MALPQEKLIEQLIHKRRSPAWAPNPSQPRMDSHASQRKHAELETNVQRTLSEKTLKQSFETPRETYHGGLYAGTLQHLQL